VLSRADLVLAPSDFLARAFEDWGLEVRVIPNVLDLDRYAYRRRDDIRPRILWMRTFHEHYDPLTAVRAFAHVVAAVPEARMTMAGADHGLLEPVKAEALRLGVADLIEFPGYMLMDAKLEAFAMHDIFLNTNVIDNMPISVLEAGASGLIPVATAVGGIPRLLTDGIDSRLVPAGDDEAAAAAILGLLADPAGASSLSEGARRMAERSGWPAVRRRWEQELALIAPGSWR
jgi:glycosyltransferase involved in cell wall biosynthesis